ncbi:carotenoid oxygenase family protein [Romeria aff. gracilis LEGE 07310]|uniref:Carotenoid oxygenase family protein n=1 Tax=Vasconcelosia minhoensis LEGE 07310 TaxID=915328 RepID=A0A8J7A849_9CYAN|nr:carotenoid oxygenase family protein [Romeria gracilis]MBE9078827.1 carotenoid oxygenase family protein [Romeria aff. gracilis LEGE 07310]
MQTINNTNPAATAYAMDDWRSGYRSQPQEFAYWIDEVEGTIPPALSGTIFRNGPGLLDIGGYPVRHPFDGDGLISSIAFSQGRAFYRSRFVRTAGYVSEQAAGKPLYRGVFGTQKPGGPLANAFDLRLKNIANTNIIYWGGKLLALWEAAEPHRLDPHTLETLGLDYLDGLLQAGDPFAAHPKIDPSCDRAQGQPCLVNFAVKTGLSSKIILYEFDPAGRLVHQCSHTIPGFAFMHDFAITPDYAIFVQNPVSFNPLPFILGLKGAGECIGFNPKQPTQIFAIPRDGQSPVRRFETDASFVFHHANAYEADGELVLDSIRYDRFPSLDDSADYSEVDFDHVPAGQLWRFRANLDNSQVSTEVLIERCCEFPHIHPQRVGQPYRYLYIGAAHSAQGNAPLQALLKQDLHTGQEQLWSAAPRGFSGEPLFVPRPGSSAEDDGWVLLMLYNAERRCSDLAIFDARDITPGPVTRLLLKHHIPYGLHGSYTPDYFGPAAS